jgi:hypothetical protein
VGAVVVGLLVLSGWLIAPIEWQEWPEADLALRSFLTRSEDPERFVVVDNQLVAFLAGRSVPPQLVDTSAKRISTGYLTSADVIDAILSYTPSHLIFAYERFEQLDPLESWVARHGDDLSVHADLEVFRLETPPSPAVPLRASIGPNLQLLGYTILPEPPGAVDEPLTITLSWQATAPIGSDLHIFIHVLDSDGSIVAQVDGPPMDGLLPTTRWRPGVTVPVELHLPQGLKAGSYSLQTGAYTWPEEERWPITLESGEAMPDDVLQFAPFVVE